MQGGDEQPKKDSTFFRSFGFISLQVHLTLFPEATCH